MKHWVCLLALLSLVACGKSDGGKSGQSTQSNESSTPSTSVDPRDNTVETRSLTISAVRKVELAEDLSNVSEFKKNINSYQIVFNAKGGTFPEADIICKKILYNRLQTTFTDKFDKNGHSGTIDIELLPDDTSEVSLDCMVKDHGLVIEKAKLNLRKSYIVSGKKNFVASINAKSIETLFLDKGAELSSNGDELEFEAKEIISLGGKIVTFHAEESNSTLENRNGADGGSIKAKLGTGRGELYFEMRGLNGGVQTFVPEAIDIKIKADSNLDGKCSGNYGTNVPPKKNDKRCFGQPGVQGLQGKEGMPGFDGGKTGKLNLTVTNDHSLKLNVSFFPGVGGKGGKGGKGGEGQPGGIGSTIKWDNGPADVSGTGGGGCCRLKAFYGRFQTYKFPDGAQGPQGYEGNAGADGKMGDIIPAQIDIQVINKVLEVNQNWANE